MEAKNHLSVSEAGYSKKENSGSNSLNSSFDEDEDEAEGKVKMSAEGKNPRRTCCKLGMNPGVTPINIFSLLLSHFIVILIMSLETTFTSYLLKENYDIHGDEVAEVAGNLGFVGDVGSVTMELLSGPIMDLFGRKSISVGGLAVASVAMFCKPLLRSLTGLYILKVLTNMGTVPLMFGPY